MTYELRYYFNKHQHEVVATYNNQALAYGMRKKKSRENPTTYPLQNLKVVPIK